MSHFPWPGTSGKCKFNGSCVNAKGMAEKKMFFLDWIEKQFGQVT